MSENKKLVPKRRFKEFENADTWVKRKLGEMAESFAYGLNTAAIDFDGKNKYLRITDIDEDTHEFKTDALTSPDVDLDAVDSYRLKEGDVLFARTGASVGKTYRYTNDDGIVFFAGFLIRARIKSLYNSEFVFQNTLTDNYSRFITVTSQRSGQPGVNAQEYCEFSIFTPDFSEQTAIGNFFHTLDTAITFHQRKLEKMKSMKSAYLSEMFPAEGERKPKRRFLGFTDDWEQRELIKVANYRNGKAHEQDISEDGTYVVVNSKFISTNGTVRKFASKQNEPLLKDEIAFVLSDVPNGRAIARTYLVPESGNYTLNQRIAGITPKGETYAYFLYILMNRNKYFLAFDTGVGQTNLSRAQVEQFKGFYPSFEEQVKIGDFFYKLDQTIAFQQQKLEKLQNIKKAYLNEMLI